MGFTWTLATTMESNERGFVAGNGGGVVQVVAHRKDDAKKNRLYAEMRA